MNSYTPGPWENHMEKMGGWIGSNGESVFSCDGHGAPSDADSRLITASPDLLKACKEALKSLTHKDTEGPIFNYSQTISILKEAIKKATGDIA